MSQEGAWQQNGNHLAADMEMLRLAGFEQDQRSQSPTDGLVGLSRLSNKIKQVECREGEFRIWAIVYHCR